MNDLLRVKGIGCTWPDTDAYKVKETAFRDSLVFWDIVQGGGDGEVEGQVHHGSYSQSASKFGKIAGSTVLPENAGSLSPGVGMSAGGAGAGARTGAGANIIQITENPNVRI